MLWYQYCSNFWGSFYIYGVPPSHSTYVIVINDMQWYTGILFKVHCTCASSMYYKNASYLHYTCFTRSKTFRCDIECIYVVKYTKLFICSKYLANMTKNENNELA